MAYFVIARDPKSHNEWVMPKTFETILETAEYAEHCRTSDPRFRYRIEGKESGETIAPAGNHVEELRDIGHHTKDFTMAELFPEDDYFCNECACNVGPRNIQRERHTAWHNKLLP